MTANRRHSGTCDACPVASTRPAIGTKAGATLLHRPSSQRADANAFLDAALRRHASWGLDRSRARANLVRPQRRPWLAQRTDIRPRTREQYELLVGDKLKPAFGHHELARITPVHVRSWYADIAASTPGSARSAYRLLKAIFNTAVIDDLLVKNPCRVKGGGTDRVSDRPIPNVDQVAALTQAMPEQYRATVTLAAWGTLRRGEVLGLNRERHRPSSGHRPGRALAARVLRRPARARPDQERRIPQGLHAELGHAGARAAPAPLRRARERRSPLRRRHGTTVTSEQLGVIWEAARRRVNLKSVRFHDRRHFAATMFASTGASTKEIMSQGGWKSVAKKVRYEHASEERDAFPTQALNQFAERSNVVSITIASPGDRARSAHDDAEAEEGDGEVFDLARSDQRERRGVLRG